MDTQKQKTQKNVYQHENRQQRIFSSDEKIYCMEGLPTQPHEHKLIETPVSEIYYFRNFIGSKNVTWGKKSTIS